MDKWENEMRTNYNPERSSWKSVSYKKGGMLVKDLKEQVLRKSIKKELGKECGRW